MYYITLLNSDPHTAVYAIKKTKTSEQNEEEKVYLILSPLIIVIWSVLKKLKFFFCINKNTLLKIHTGAFNSNSAIKNLPFNGCR